MAKLTTRQKVVKMRLAHAGVNSRYATELSQIMLGYKAQVGHCSRFSAQYLGSTLVVIEGLDQNDREF
jgi:hypothetical protein